MLRKAVGLSMAANYGSLILNFASVVLASRYLSPTDAGLYAVCLAFTTIISTLLDFNIVNFGLQTKDLTEKILGSMYGLSILITAPSLVLLFVFEDFFTFFLGQENAEPTYLIMIFSLAIAPATVAATAKLKKSVDYAPILASTLISSVFRFGLSWLLLAQNFGVEALALAYTAGKLLEAICLLAARPASIRVKPNWRGLPEILKFSSVSTFAQAAGTIGFSISEMATGFFLGLHYAGLYNRGSTLTNVYRTGIERSIYPIALAALSEEFHKPEGNVGDKFVFSLSLLTGIGWPAFLMLYFLSPTIVPLVFGPNWTEAIPVAQILSVACAIYVFCALTPSALMATNNTRTLLIREIVIQGSRVALVLVAVRFGINEVAYAILATYALAAIFDLILFSKLFSIPHEKLIYSILKSSIVTSTIFIAVYIASIFLEIENASPILRFASISILGLMVWITAIYLTKHPLWAEIEATASSIKRKIRRIKAVS